MPDEAPPQPLSVHFRELRQRLMHSAVAVLLAFLALLPFAGQLYEWLSVPLASLLPPGVSIIATEVAAPLIIPLKLALSGAVFLVAPYLLYQLWLFTAPGLYRHEKIFARALLACSVVLFYAGAAFCYAVVLPLVFKFFNAVTPASVEMMTDMRHYYDFVLRLFLLFGLAFEVPIAVLLLIKAGIADVAALRRARSYVIVASFALSMLVTPPDVFSQILLAVPVWLLYEVGLLLGGQLSPPPLGQAAVAGEVSGELPAPPPSPGG